MLAPQTYTLAPTATCSRRIAVWIPRRHPEPDSLGLLLFDQSGKLTTQWYGLEEWRSLQLSTRRFALTADDKQYVVQIGVVSGCTCDAGTKGRRRTCKHLAALEAIHRPTVSITEWIAKQKGIES